MFLRKSLILDNYSDCGGTATVKFISYIAGTMIIIVICQSKLRLVTLTYVQIHVVKYKFVYISL